MRVFFAIEFDDETKDYIKKIQDILRKNSVKGNFSRRENFHLTLKFIGEVDKGELETLKSSLDAAAEKSKPFEIEFNNLGFFSRGNRKIMWLGIKDKDGCLNKLFNNFNKFLEERGYGNDEKGYRPHITLSRETILDEGFEEMLNSVKIEERRLIISRISLMESKRVEGKLKYIPLYVREI